MCKVCKHCGKSDFGATRTRKVIDAVRIIDGDIKEVFENSQEEVDGSEEFEINYCFTCNKEITEDDLVTEVKCPICGKMVDHLTEDGMCEDCKDEVVKLASMSKEEIILILMKQQAKAVVTEPQPKKAKKEKQKTKKEETSNKPVTKEEKNDIMNEADKIVASQVENDSAKKTKEETKKEKATVSKEPVPVEETEVKAAETLNKEKVANATADSVDADKVENIDETQVENDINSSMPTEDMTSIPDLNTPSEDLVNDTLNEIDAMLSGLGEIDDMSAEKTSEEQINNEDALF